MVQKDQNRNEWKMPLELFDYFGRESFSVLRVLFEIKIEMPQLDKLTYFSQFFWLCLLLFTFYILLMESSGQKRGSSVVEASCACISYEFPDPP
jgi:hypothetical protein